MGSNLQTRQVFTLRTAEFRRADAPSSVASSERLRGRGSAERGGRRRGQLRGERAGGDAAGLGGTPRQRSGLTLKESEIGSTFNRSWQVGTADWVLPLLECFNGE